MYYSREINDKRSIHHPYIKFSCRGDEDEILRLLPSDWAFWERLRIWVNYNELTTSEPWKSWLGIGKSSPNGLNSG